LLQVSGTPIAVVSLIVVGLNKKIPDQLEKKSGEVDCGGKDGAPDEGLSPKTKGSLPTTVPRVGWETGGGLGERMQK